MNVVLLFFFKIIEMVFGSLFRNNTRRKYYIPNRNYKNLSKTEQVKLLERVRQKKGYKKHWLYFRCKEESLLREYYKLFPDRHSIKQMNEDSGYTEFIRFSFGKYHDEPIDTIWAKDKQYITLELLPLLGQKKFMTLFFIRLN